MPKLNPVERISRALEEQLVAGTLDVPVLPTVATRILALLAESNPEPRALSQLISRDPILAAHIIRIANCPAMRATGAIVDTRQAIARLGLRRVADVALSACLGPRLFVAPGCEALLERIWNESLATAAWASELVRQLRRHADGAFLCGLLARIGEPVVLQAIQRLGGNCQAEDMARLLERHAQLAGVRVGKAWHLPTPVTECILWLRDFNAAQAKDLVAMIAMARTLAPLALDAALEADPAALAVRDEFLACGLDAAAIAELLAARASVQAMVLEMQH